MQDPTDDDDVDSEIDAALEGKSKPPPKYGDAGNLELWDTVESDED